MTTKERFERMYAHQEADRVPIFDRAWPETVRRWVAEGMPGDDYVRAFDLDLIASFGVDNSPRYPEQVLEETSEHVIRTTRWGETQKVFKNRTTTPQALSFRVNTPDAWREAKERMRASDDRIPWKLLSENYARWRAQGRWIVGEFWFGFDITHSHMVGTETLLAAMLEEPEWVEDMFRHELMLDMQMMDRVWEAGYRFDEVRWPDDMGYKCAQFFSPRIYRQLLKPYHQMAIDWAHARGIRARLHSCGDIRPFVPELADMGLDALNPIEVKAGMDPVLLKREFGDRMTLHGGVNAVLWDQPEAILAEIARLLPILKERGGYIFASDHSIPPSVSLADFRAIIEAVKRYGAY